MCFWRASGSRGQDLLVGSQTISRLLSTQYGIYAELFLLFWLFCLVLGTSTFSGRDEGGRVTWRMHVIYARKHKYRVPATCKLSPVVECHQSIAPPFALPPFLWLYQWEPLPSYIFGERRRDRTCNLLIRSQVVAFAFRSIDYPRRNPLLYPSTP